MREKKEYMEQIYEQFSQDIAPTEEMRKIYKRFSNKIEELREKFDEEQIKDLDKLEDLFSEMASLEVKQTFFKGFAVALNISLENVD